MLMFSLSELVWSQKRFGGGLQTSCPVGMWKATALVALLAVSAFLQPSELSPEYGPFRFVLSWALSLSLDCLLFSEVSCLDVSSFLLFPF